MIVGNFDLARAQAAWKQRVVEAWDGVHVTQKQVFDTSNKAVPLGENFEATISIYLNGLSTEDIGIEWVFGKRKLDGFLNTMLVKEIAYESLHEGVATFKCSMKMNLAGVYEYGFRIFPKNKNLPHRQDFGLVKWI
jgi:hypothetical protein